MPDCVHILLYFVYWYTIYTWCVYFEMRKNIYVDRERERDNKDVTTEIRWLVALSRTSSQCQCQRLPTGNCYASNNFPLILWAIQSGMLLDDMSNE